MLGKHLRGIPGEEPEESEVAAGRDKPTYRGAVTGDLSLGLPPKGLSRADWDMVHLGFLRRLFASGSNAALAFGCVALGATILTLRASPEHAWIPFCICAFFLVLSLPGFFNLPYPVLVVIGCGDIVMAIVLFILGFPLAFVSMAWLVTDIVAARLWNAGNWILGCGQRYQELVGAIAKDPSLQRLDLDSIADGILPGGRSGFWGAESESGPFWAVEKTGDGLFVHSSQEGELVRRAEEDQLKAARLSAPRHLEDKDKRKKLSGYPTEHVLEWHLKPLEGQELGLTLMLRPLAAQVLAREFLPDRPEIAKAARKTSRFAVASAFLSFLGPIGVVCGVISLLRISRSEGRLKGAFHSWCGIVFGSIFSGLFLLPVVFE